MVPGGWGSACNPPVCPHCVPSPVGSQASRWGCCYLWGTSPAHYGASNHALGAGSSSQQGCALNPPPPPQMSSLPSPCRALWSWGSNSLASPSPPPGTDFSGTACVFLFFHPLKKRMMRRRDTGVRVVVREEKTRHRGEPEILSILRRRFSRGMETPRWPGFLLFLPYIISSFLLFLPEALPPLSLQCFVALGEQRNPRGSGEEMFAVQGLSSRWWSLSHCLQTGKTSGPTAPTGLQDWGCASMGAWDWEPATLGLGGAAVRLGWGTRGWV